MAGYISWTRFSEPRSKPVALRPRQGPRPKASCFWGDKGGLGGLGEKGGEGGRKRCNPLPEKVQPASSFRGEKVQSPAIKGAIYFTLAKEKVQPASPFLIGKGSLSFILCTAPMGWLTDRECSVPVPPGAGGPEIVSRRHEGLRGFGGADTTAGRMAAWKSCAAVALPLRLDQMCRRAPPLPSHPAGRDGGKSAGRESEVGGELSREPPPRPTWSS